MKKDALYRKIRQVQEELVPTLDLLIFLFHQKILFFYQNFKSFVAMRATLSLCYVRLRNYTTSITILVPAAYTIFNKLICP